MLTPTETAELHYAFDAMVGDCMRAFGASWRHESLADYRRAAQDVLKYTMSWEYGVTDARDAYTGSRLSCQRGTETWTISSCKASATRTPGALLPLSLSLPARWTGERCRRAAARARPGGRLTTQAGLDGAVPLSISGRRLWQ